MKDRVRRSLSFPSRRSMDPAAVSLCLLLLFASTQQASAVSCHCFRDRTYEPARPASADPYILATARNSLVAAASGIDKGAVVRERMTGSTETDLWLSRYLPARLEKPAENFGGARDRASSWAEALDALELDTSSLGKAFNEARKERDAGKMARALAEQVLGRAFEADDGTLGRLRSQGTNIAEAALCLYLADLTKRTPEDVWEEVRSGRTTWGALLHSLGIRVDTVGDLIARTVSAAKD